MSKAPKGGTRAMGTWPIQKPQEYKGKKNDSTPGFIFFLFLLLGRHRGAFPRLS